MGFKLKRYEGNPILKPNPQNEWEEYVVFNAAAIYLDDKIHIIYRARNGREKGMISRLGYASTKDGFTIDERLPYPVYEPEGDWEKFGCEDPRIVQIGDELILTYTAYGIWPGMKTEKPKEIIQLAMNRIKVEDFLSKNWRWGKRYYPFLGVDNKHGILFPEKFGDKYVMYIRIPPHMWICYSKDLVHWKNLNILLSPQYEWEHFKVGGGAQPIKTEHGWLIIYHAVDRYMVYRLGFFFADLDDPSKIIYRHPEPILEPEKEFETQGDVANVVFTCGAVLKDGTVYVYYGGADTVICVATAEIDEFYKVAGF